MMKVSILTENTVYKRGFLGEHGLSLLIEYQGKRYLFDTGQSQVFLHNAQKLRLQKKDLDGIILSHGHYDHGGGMEYVREWGNDVPVYVQQKAFEKKYTENPRNKEIRYIGLENAAGWQQGKGICRLQGGCTKIGEGVYLLSEIPYTTEFEPMPDGFWREVLKVQEPELEADPMADEQLLVMEHEQGLSIFAGCAHPGIINCLKYVQSEFPGVPVHSLVAGMHLKSCDSQRIRRTIRALQEMGIDIVVPLHCTGIRAIGMIKEVLGERCILAEAGRQIEI
ncbi:MBL fold metallo-hydrolase [Lachnospiraceae bacterium]|nr:MBL fold metallo-hydrolase [Lachnospiraceae bacterium]